MKKFFMPSDLALLLAASALGTKGVTRDGSLEGGARA
jgi:hypothetical protein